MRIESLALMTTTAMLAALLSQCSLGSQAADSMTPSDALVILTEKELRDAMTGFASVDEAIAYQRTLGREERDPLGPVIRVEAPNLGSGPVCTPTEIEVRWSAKTRDAQVDPGSMRIRASLGLLSKDLTEQVREKGTVDRDGIKVPRSTMALLPASVSKVRVTVAVSDDKKRRTEEEFVLQLKAC